MKVFVSLVKKTKMSSSRRSLCQERGAYIYLIDKDQMVLRKRMNIEEHAILRNAETICFRTNLTFLESITATQ